METEEKGKINIQMIFKYVYNVISWTIFTLLIIIACLLIYYFVSVRLYSRFGDKFEPKFSVYTIVSQSMTPTINVYDVIVNTKINSIDDVKTNDVITFISTWNVNNGMTVTHRVAGIKYLDNGEKCLITRGDYNTNEDPSCVKEENIIGITRAVIPKLGNIQALLANKIGWIIIVILPATYIIIKDVLKIVRMAEEDKKDNPKKEKKKAKK